MRSYLAVPLVAVTCLTADVGAQIIQPRATTRPQTWVSGHVGYQRLATVNDGTTNSRWDFGDGVGFRVALERAMQAGVSLGVGATFARAPLTYRDLNAGAVCSACDADANVTQLFATLHSGGGSVGFHQVLDIGVGMTGYHNFSTRQGNEQIGPESVDWDLMFMLGYGFGFALSERLHVQLVQDFSTSIHQREGLPGGSSSASPMYVTRIGIRYGM